MPINEQTYKQRQKQENVRTSKNQSNKGTKNKQKQANVQTNKQSEK